MNRVLSRSPRHFESSESARKRPHEAVAAAVVDGSCLIDACNVGDLEAVRRLLDEGRNVNEITEEGESLLSLACSSGYAELAQLLLATRANVEDRGLKDTTPLMEASSAGHVDIVKLLISHGANVNAQTSQGNTPLMYACAGGHVEVVKVLIEAGSNIEDHNENGHTPLMEAASAGHVAVAKILVEKGASINSHSDEFKESALTLACYKGHLEMVRFLLEAGADQEHKTEEMHTALMEASMDGHVEVARLLLDSGAQVNMPADSFESPLTLASCGGHVELAMLLLERGANIEEVNDEGYTPLMEAAREGQEEMVALLLSQGADINALTEETQETALTLACCSNSLEVADFLIKAGADYEAGGNTPLMEAAQEGHIELVKHLINVGANINATNANGETALMHACENGHTDVAEILLDASADLEHEADGGRTPLMKTSRAGHLCTVQFLVSRGANVNKVTPTNDATPLSLASAGGHLSVVEYLLSQGADPTHRLKDNATMLMEAAKGGHTKVVQLLLDYPNAICRSPPPEDASSTSGPNLSSNITSPEQCDTSTTTTITTTTTTTTSRVVQRGSILASQETSDNQVTSTSSQRKSSSISNASGKYGLPKTSRNKSLSFNKPSESVEPYIPLPKGRNSSASGKHLERSLSDSSTSQLLNSVNLLSNSTDNSSSSCSSGTDAFKDAETLSQCISVKLDSSDDLSPSSREQQILHKQQILEELVRVEKELQEKRQEHLLLNQQAEQQQQLIQTLCYEADLSPKDQRYSSASASTSVCASASVSASSNTSLVSDDGHNNLLQASADQQSHSLNNLTSNLSSQAMLLLDMTALKQQLKAGDPLSFQLPSSLTASGTIPNSQPSTILLQTSFGESNVTSSAINSSNSTSTTTSNSSISSSNTVTDTTDNNFALNGLNKTLSDIPASSVVPQIMTSSSFSPSTVSPTSSSGSNRSRTRQTIKVKNAFSKIHHQPQPQPPPPPPPPSPPQTVLSTDTMAPVEDVETMNLRNTMSNEPSQTLTLTASQVSSITPITSLPTTATSSATTTSPSSTTATTFSTSNVTTSPVIAQPIFESAQNMNPQSQQAILEWAQTIGQQKPDALQFLQQTASSMKFDANYPFFFPSWLDLNSLDNLNQANLPQLSQLTSQSSQPITPPLPQTQQQQSQPATPRTPPSPSPSQTSQSQSSTEVSPNNQQTQATQTLISSLSNMLNSNFRRQLKLIYANDPSSSSSLQTSIQLQSQPQQSQSTQATQTPSLEGLNGEAIANLVPIKSSSNRSTITGKVAKTSKASNKGTSSNQANLQKTSQYSQTNLPMSSSLSLTNQHIQALKSHLTAVAVSQQADSTTPSATLIDNEQENLSTTTSSSTPTVSMVPTSNVFTLGAPAFPVNLSLSPSMSTTSPTPSAGNVSTTTVFTPPITLEMADGSTSSFVLSAPPKITDDVSLDFSDSSSSQIISSLDALNHQTSPSGSGTLFSSSVGPLIESFNFSSIPVSSGTFSQSPSILSSPGTIATSMALPVITSPSSMISASADSMTRTPSIDLLIESETQTPSGPPLPSTISISTGTSSLTLATAKLNPATSPPPWYPPIDLDSQTDSNHDTALTLACAGGHEELVELLIKRGANIEHRDKKGFTPLMLAATAGHAGVCELLLSHSADIEAQSERTKDTALSLACSSGRYEVVELLLEKGANKEHRNVSDYTPLSLAASGGYVNIIKLLLSHGAEINSRTGSKLGISPLMLAAMNGHTGTVKLLLDMGSDINAQIETNRNTALTLACFQGRKEVVDLLLDRKANVEHRAKTGLTPLMEAASGGYVEVGRILLDKGADVNAPPVPSSRDTALTISADKGHYRFVELLLHRGSQVDVKNKKGSSPLWLACNGGHLDVVQLLVNVKADIDSQDNRKVSCLMAAFRKGHVKVVKWMVKHVTQFPSDQEMTRYIAMINDDELLKKCHQCLEHIRAAKEKQAAEANKNATILLEEIDMERYREETRKLAAARRREKKRLKKKEKQEKEKAAKAAQESKDLATNKQKQGNKRKGNNEKIKLEESESDSDDDSDDEDDNNIFEDITVIKNNQVNQSPAKEVKKSRQSSEDPQPPIKMEVDVMEQPGEIKMTSTPIKKKEAEKNKKNQAQKENNNALTSHKQLNEKKDNRDVKKSEVPTDKSTVTKGKSKNVRDHDNQNVPTDRGNSPNHENQTKSITHPGVNEKKYSDKNQATESNRKNLNDAFLNELNIEVTRDITSEKTTNSQKSPCATVSTKSTSSSVSNVSVGNSGASSLSNQATGIKKGQKREEGWKEVVRRSKKVSVPANAISRVIGRGGCNINAVREISGAHIEVEKQKGQGDRQIIIKGSADATRHAQQLINALVNDTDKDLSQIVSQLGLSRSASSNEDDISFSRSGPVKSFSSTSVISSQANRSSTTVSMPNPLVSVYSSGVTKSSSVSAVFTTASHTASSTAGPVSARASSGVVSVRASAPINNSAPPFGGSMSTGSSTNAWGTPKPSMPPRMQSNSSAQFTNSTVTTSSLTFSTTSTSSALTSGSKTTISYTTAVSSKPKTVVKSSTQPVNNLTSTKFITGPESKPSGGVPFAAPVRPLTQPFNSASRVIGPTTPNKNVTSKQPFGTNTNNNNNSSGGSNASNSTNSGNASNNSVNPNSNSNVSNASSMTTTTTTITSSTSALPIPKTSSASNVPGSPSVPNTTPEYTPFNNLFSKVAQASVWGPSKEAHKPNFASVAATGISSVATSQSATQSMTITSTSSNEPDMSVDVSKAPGYRGNLHSSPGNPSIPSTSSSTVGSNFGPIGSGPRNAPCTPPLSTISGIVSSAAPVRSPISTGTSVIPAVTSSTSPSSPPPASSVSLQPSASSSQSNRTMMKDSASSVDLSPAVVSVYSSNSNNTSNISSGFQSTVTSNVYTSSSISNHQTIKQQSNFNLTPGSNVTRGYSTTTTYSQHHGPLSSVDPIHPAMASGLSDPHACVSSINPNNLINTTVQSSLNPNAPDFSIRSNPNYIPNLSHQQNGPLVPRSSAHQHHLSAVSPRSMGYQDLVPVSGMQLANPQAHPQLHMQMRAAILAAGASLQMQTLQAQAAQAAQAAQSAQAAQVAQVAQVAQNHVRYSLGPPNTPSPGLHPQIQTPSPLSGGEYSPPSAETLRLLQSALTAFPAANAVLQQSPPQNMQPYNMMQSPISMRQAQQINSSQGQQQPQAQQTTQQTHQQQQISQQLHHPGQQASSQRTSQAGGSKEADMSDMSEERKLPRPIGTERAQKKNPIHGISSSNMVYSPGVQENLQPNLWPFPNSGEIPSESNEWLLSGTNTAPNDELMASMMPINYMMNRNYVSMNENVPEQHEPDYTVGYPYFPSDI